MRVRHNFGPENGPQNTVTTDLIPRKAQTQAGGPPSDLVGGLRWWARCHNWYELDYVRNRLKLEWAFAEPIRQTANQFMADRRGTLARQVKDDFTDLLDMAQEFDDICRLGCSCEDEYKVCQDIRGRLGKMLGELAELIESGNQAEAIVNDSGGASENTPKKASKTEWVTYKEAAGLLGVRKSTVSFSSYKGHFAAGS